MESGDHQSGLGSIQWWGFSPSLDLASYETKNSESELNYLIVGAGDIRHILHTISKNPGRKINFWIYEAQIEVIARQMALLLVISEPDTAYGMNIKTSLYLDIFGNSLIRAVTHKYLMQKSTVLSEMITDFGYMKERASFLNLDRLKFKDRDRLDDQFTFWRRPEEFQIQAQWDIRLRRYLGMRYDAKNGAFDWNLSMQFYERKATMITKLEYYRFREIGVAFSPTENENHENPNKTLSSSKVMANQRGDKNAYRGYWGDIIVGPFISHGIETENKEMLKTVNKKPSTSSEIIAHWNVENYLERMHKRESANSYISTNLTRRREKYRSHYMNGISVNFLSPTGFDELENSPWSNQLFDAIFLSTANAGKLQNKDFIQHCLKPNGFVLVESPTYILDLKPEQVTETVKTINIFAENATLTNVRDESVTAILTFQRA